MDKFLKLPLEKQNIIVDAALETFGSNGYKKASVNDIATAAGVSKALIFHYFRNKKSLYLYLLTLCKESLLMAMEEGVDFKTTDFFDRIQCATKVKVAVMRKHPAILLFLNSAFFETDIEVVDEINNILSVGDTFREHIALDGMDVSKFKEGVDPRLVMKILVMFTEGYITKIPLKTDEDLDKLLKEFDSSLKLMKNNFYKEEFL